MSEWKWDCPFISWNCYTVATTRIVREHTVVNMMCVESDSEKRKSSTTWDASEKFGEPTEFWDKKGPQSRSLSSRWYVRAVGFVHLLPKRTRIGTTMPLSFLVSGNRSPCSMPWLRRNLNIPDCGACRFSVEKTRTELTAIRNDILSGKL